MKNKIFAVVKSAGYLLLWMACEFIGAIIAAQDVILSTALGNLIFLVVLLVIFGIKKTNIYKKLKIEKISLKEGIVVIVLSLAINLAFQSIQLFFPEEMRMELIENASMILSGNAVLAFITVAILAPITEEIVFRGLIFTTLKTDMNVYVAATIQAVIFGVLHGDLIWMLVAIPTALFYAFLMERYKSILAPVLGHISVNILAFICN